MKRTFKKIVLAAFAVALTSTVALSQSFENDRIYNAYLKIQEATVAGNFEEALQGINKLANYKTADVETAAILRARGFILLNLQRETEAIDDFQTALRLNVLNQVMQQEMRYVVTNLLASAEKWEEAFGIYQTWLNTATAPGAEEEDLPQPDADAYTLGAAIASNCDDYPFAIDCAEKAIAISSKPDRDLYNLLIALHFQSGDLKEAIFALQRALANFPNDDEFWQNLSGIYQMIKEDKEALAALVISYEEGLMESAEEYLLLGRYFLFNKMPFNGAKVLTSGIEEGLIAENQENLELLSQAWYSAREYDKSLEILKQIVRTTGDEQATLRASQILIDKEEYPEALELLDIGEDRGQFEELGTLYKLKGYALYGLKDYVGAVDALSKAASSDPELSEEIEQWVSYLKTEYLATSN